MILSTQHNFIYIRTKKTGSTTIETVLKESLGPDDVVVGKRLAALRRLLKPGAQIPEHRKGSLAPTHVAIDQVQPVLREEFWQNAFKFTSERHPYEKAVSLAHMRLGRAQRQNKTFDAVLDKVVRQGMYAGFPLYSIAGRPVVDDFIRLETLEADLRRVGQRIGIPIPEILPKARSEYRVDRRPAREVLSDEQKEIIWQHCRKEFEILGYDR
jgi:hypothetical protein